MSPTQLDLGPMFAGMQQDAINQIARELGRLCACGLVREGFVEAGHAITVDFGEIGVVGKALL